MLPSGEDRGGASAFLPESGIENLRAEGSAQAVLVMFCTGLWVGLFARMVASLRESDLTHLTSRKTKFWSSWFSESSVSEHICKLEGWGFLKCVGCEWA